MTKGAKILAFGKSIHAGQTGTVVADYGTMILVKADDESYVNARKNSIGEGKYFQVDNLLCKELT
jgi:hypothetical protein